MTTEDAYISRIRRMDSARLQDMLQRLSAGQAINGWNRGKAFEYVIVRAFEIEGAAVTYPFAVHHEGHIIEQIDGAVYDEGISCLIEAKDYSGPINIEPIAKLRNQLTRRPPSTLGLVFARSGFTEPAKLLTRFITPLNILLWEYSELEAAVRAQQMRDALRMKFRTAVEQGVPDYNYLEATL